LLPATNSWYMGVNIAGRKREALCYVGGVDEYIKHLRRNEEEQYPGCMMS